MEFQALLQEIRLDVANVSYAKSVWLNRVDSDTIVSCKIIFTPCVEVRGSQTRGVYNGSRGPAQRWAQLEQKWVRENPTAPGMFTLGNLKQHFWSNSGQKTQRRRRNHTCSNITFALWTITIETVMDSASYFLKIKFPQLHLHSHPQESCVLWRIIGHSLFPQSLFQLHSCAQPVIGNAKFLKGH